MKLFNILSTIFLTSKLQLTMAQGGRLRKYTPPVEAAASSNPPVEAAAGSNPPVEAAAGSNPPVEAAAGSISLFQLFKKCYQGQILDDYYKKIVLGQYFPTSTIRDTSAYTFTVTDVMKDKVRDKAIHVRLNMKYLGLRVFGGDSVVHVIKKKDAISITKTIQKPIMTTPDEIKQARKTLGNSNDTELVFYSDILTTPLCVDRNITGISQDRTPMVGHLIYLISEYPNGKILRNFTDTKTFRNTGWPYSRLEPWTYNSTKVVDAPCSKDERFIAIGHTMYSGKVNLSVSFTEGHYVLADTDRQCHYTVSSTDLVFADNKDHDRIQTLDETTWGDGTRSDEHTASADAHYGHAAAFDFFRDTFGRRGVYNDKDKNARRIYSRVHVGKKYSNAFWHEDEMSYGDGDDITTRPLVSLEVAAHLYTHGLIENTANLEYTGESGALSEATADIMSVLIDYYTVDREFRDPNYLIGESINFQPGIFQRSLIQPSSDIVNYEANGRKDALGNPEGSYDCYCSGIGNVDVHMSSGVANHFFYLLAEGTEEGAGGPSKVCSDCRQTATTLKTLKKIGRAKAGEIWYTALTQYFVSHTNYTLARDATLLAALDLVDVYGDCEAFNATNSAWDAVNLHYPIHQFSCPR